MPPPQALEALALHLARDGPVKTLSTPKRIRILHNGSYIADTNSAIYIWEHEYYPQYYLPASNFSEGSMTGSENVVDDSGRTVARIMEFPAGKGKGVAKALYFSNDLDGKASVLKGMVKAVFGDFDQWLEEDSPIYVHPKDPYKRVDIISSSRPLKISLSGTLLAEAPHSMHLYETGLPVRYYFPLPFIDASKLTRSDTTSQCPYKGTANYWNVTVDRKEIKDLVWYYERPTVECAAVEGLCCFYSEKVDIEIMEDGKWKKLERPKSPFA